MVTDPVSALRHKVHHLIDLQIEVLRQESSLSPDKLLDYNARSKRIQTLYVELDRMGRTRLAPKLARAS
jgi:hypothetical protein